MPTNESKLEIWLNTNLTRVEGRYRKVGTITLTAEYDLGDEEHKFTHEIVGALHDILAQQIEDQHMSPHSSLWIARPGRVWETRFMVKYMDGDATKPVGEGNKIIVHVCNDIGAWGAGFVLALERKWPVTKQQYLTWKRKHEAEFLPLGEVQFVRVEEDTWVANLIGQHLVGMDEEGKSCIRYEAVEQGLQKVAERARELDASIHMPRIGCGLAGGTWARMGPIVEGQLEGLDVTVYDFRL